MSHKLNSVKCTWITSKTTTGHLQHTDFCLSVTLSTQLHLSLSCVQHASITNCVCCLRACSSSAHWFVPEGTRIQEIRHCSKITCVIFLTDKRCWLMSLLSCEKKLSVSWSSWAAAVDEYEWRGSCTHQSWSVTDVTTVNSVSSYMKAASTEKSKCVSKLC